MKHTPGPWRYEYDDYQGDGITQAIRNDKGITICGRVIPDDARFIVRAVDCHEDLLEALKEITDHATKYGAAPFSAVKMFDRARAAIAKAEGVAP